jgi:hypothetical protein
MEALDAYELEALYSLAVKEARASQSEVSTDDLVYKEFVKFWDKLSDKLRVMHEQA